MKVKIKNLDPTGVEVEVEEFEFPIVVEDKSREGCKEEIQLDGTVITYEPTRKIGISWRLVITYIG